MHFRYKPHRRNPAPIPCEKLVKDFESYRHYSRLFKEAVGKIAPKIENRGIDEIYIDLSDYEEEIQDHSFVPLWSIKQ